MLMLGLISKHSCTHGVTAASMPWQTADANKFRTAVSLKSSFIKHAREAKKKQQCELPPAGDKGLCYTFNL